MHVFFLVGGYMLAILLANAGVAAWGPWFLPVTAVLLIPLDLTTRDILHEYWHGRGLVWRMGLLVGAGALLTWLVVPSSSRIAAASVISFSVSAVVDTVVCQALYHRGRWVRMNGSNVCSALTDSVLFPWVAFGLVSPTLTLAQASMKVVGGAVWVAILVALMRRLSAPSRPSEHG